MLIYRHYVEQDQQVAILRRNLWLANTYLRDFFIHTTPQQAAELETQLKELRLQDDAALDRLVRISSSREVIADIRKSMDEFCEIIEPIPQTMLEDQQRQYAFLQREIVPRRGDLYETLLSFQAADQQRLEDSEKEFSAARRNAATPSAAHPRALRAAGRRGRALQPPARGEPGTPGRRHYAEVEQAKGELQQLSARLLEIEEEGRRTLSRELHDEIGQTLALLQIEISHAHGMLPRSRRPPANACGAPASWPSAPCRPFATSPCCCVRRCSTTSDSRRRSSSSWRISCGAAASPANSSRKASRTSFRTR